MSGSGGDLGYDYQAELTAFVAAHGLAGQHLAWFDDPRDVPSSWSSETGGPGDDIRITTAVSDIEVQAKHGLTRGAEFNKTFKRLVEGLKSPTLRCVLVVDPDASSPIRDELKADILRISSGRTDDLKAVTVEVIQELGETVETLTPLFARLRIIVINLSEGSDGVSAAQILLSTVVAEGKSSVAFDLLGKRYHRKIKRKAADTVYSCTQFLHTAVGLRGSGTAPALVLSRYADTIRTRSYDFYVPALELRMPIDRAWNRVMPLSTGSKNSSTFSDAALAKAIEQYHEWARLSSDTTHILDRMAAEVFCDAYSRSVIVGGPGSGKTTLARKLVHHFGRERLAIWVRLPIVAALMASGAGFEAALLNSALDSSGIGESEARHLLSSAGTLVADGLDECDPARATVAEAISAWSNNHPGTSVCVLTRPIGHSPELLPGFTHAELTPLSRQDIRSVAKALFQSRLPGEDVTSITTEFLASVERKDTVASIAARNPLLLSFLVRLHLDGQSFNGNRATLFERVVELIRTCPPANRQLAGSQLDYATGWLVAEVAGWSSVENPARATTELYKLVASAMGGGYSAMQAAEGAIRRWAEHGLLERLRVGSLDAVVFIHLALGEYLAGRYLAGRAPDQLRAVITERRRKAKWREPIILSASCGQSNLVLKTLIDLDSPSLPESGEALLAAASLNELRPEDVHADLITALLAKLQERLESPIPLVAIDAGLALIDVARFAPDQVASVAISQWDSSQEWTKFAARCSAITSRSPIVQLERVQEWLNEFTPRHSITFGFDGGRWPTGTHDLQKAALAAALKRIATELPPDTAETIVVQFVRDRDLSISMMEAIGDELDTDPYRQWVLAAQKQEVEPLLGMTEQVARSTELLKRCEVAFVNVVVRVCGTPPDENAKAHSYRLLGTLLTAMGLWNATPGDFAQATIRSGEELPQVLRGWITGLQLNPEALGREANAFLNEGCDMLQLPHLESQLNNRSVASASLNPEVLGKAMKHRSWFLARNAAPLLMCYPANDIQASVLDDVLATGAGTSLWLVGYLAQSIWAGKAFGKLLARLDKGLSDGCEYLYSPLLKSATTSEEVQQAISITLSGVRSEDPKYADKAAEALRDVNAKSLHEHEGTIRALFAHWSARGLWCDHCNKAVYGNACECHIVPVDPRKHLVYLLHSIGSLSFDELVSMSSNASGFGIAEEARKALIEQSLSDNPTLDRLITALSDGNCEVHVLNEILKLPASQLKRLSEQLQRLFSARSPGVRARIVRTLSAGWMISLEAERIARAALKDEAPEVRTAAAAVIRDIEQTS